MLVVGQRMPKRCIPSGCSNVTNLKEGISLLKLPFYDDDRPEAKRRKKKMLRICLSQGNEMVTITIFSAVFKTFQA